jgi:ribosomal protein S21
MDPNVVAIPYQLGQPWMQVEVGKKSRDYSTENDMSRLTQLCWRITLSSGSRLWVGTEPLAAQASHAGHAGLASGSVVVPAAGFSGGACPSAIAFQQRRGIISVDVHGNKVDKALRTLRRKLIDEGVRETWNKQRVFVKPSHERKRVLEEAERRNKNEGFKEKMRWILRRKARGL